MNDEQLEQHLREWPAPELPEAWRADILAKALRAARAADNPARRNWPAVLLFLRNVIARNPFTAGALTALWILIFALKVTTPVDASEREMLAHYDPSQPVYLVSLEDEIRLAELLQEQPVQDERRQIP